MATKFEELNDRRSTLSKCGADEPIFILRGQDKVAPSVILYWAFSAAIMDTPDEKIMEATKQALVMRAWQRSHRAKWPD